MFVCLFYICFFIPYLLHDQAQRVRMKVCEVGTLRLCRKASTWGLLRPGVFPCLSNWG